MATDTGRAQLLERRQKIQDSLKGWTPGPLDPATKLQFLDSKFPGRRGLAVLSAPSLAYFILETGGDAELACDMLDSALNYQDLRDPASPTYGNFFWYTHWTEVEDPNAVSFMAPWFSRVWTQHRGKLRPATARLLEERFPLILNGLMKQPWCGWHYTNIFLLTTAGRLTVTKILGDQATLDETLQQWENWVDQTSQHGVPEFNSPTYAWVDIVSLLDARENAPNEAVRREVERVLDYFYLKLFTHYHAEIGMLTGAFSRAYRVEETRGLRLDGRMKLLYHHQLGIPEVAPSYIYELAHTDYLAPEWIRRIALDKPYPLTVHANASYGKGHWVRTNYMHRAFTLGSFSNSFYSILQTPVLAAYLSPEERNYVFVRSEPELTTCYSDQIENSVLAAFCYNFHDKRHRYGDVGWENRAAKVVLGLGDATAARNALVNGAPWDGRELALASLSRVSVRLGPVVLGAVAIAGQTRLEGTGTATGDTPVVLVRDDKETRLEIHVYRSDTIAEQASPLEQAGFYLVIEESDDLAAFDAKLAKATLRAAHEDDAWKLSATNGTHTLEVTAPVSAEAVFPDRLKVGRNHPSSEFLMRTPQVELRVGELADIVRGKAEWRHR